MKRCQPHRTGPHGDVLMHIPLHRAARAAGYHKQAASQDSSVLAAKVSCHTASTARPPDGFPRQVTIPQQPAGPLRLAFTDY
jgi:cytochrome c553